MKWLLHKGQDLATSEATHAELELIADFWPHEKERIATPKLMFSNIDKAPDSSLDEVSEQAKHFRSVTDVSRMCTHSTLYESISAMFRRGAGRH